jgi:hypothetical protein
VGPWSVTDDVKKKKCLLLPNIDSSFPSPQSATVQTELFQPMKYLLQIFPFSGEEDGRSGLKFPKNEFPSAPRKICL